jgi:IclR family acetate operon transcriptional repressor
MYHMDQDKRMLSTVGKALQIIQLVAGAWDGMSLSEIADATALPKSSVVRYLATMQHHGFLERDAVTQRYHVSVTLLRIVSDGARRSPIHHLALPIMWQLREAFGETVNLAVPQGSMVLYLAVLEGTDQLRATEEVGAQAPMHSTSLGKAMMARMGPVQLQSILDQPLSQATARTICDRSTLLSELELGRQRGYSVDDGESVTGIRCVGAAIVNYRSDVVGALSIAAPASRMSMDRLCEIGARLASVADKLSAELGYRPSS